MTTPSDTPRTDSQSSFDEFYVELCDASFARKLERELTAANTQIGLLISGSKQQERQIEFLKETIQKLHKGAFEQQERIQRLVEEGDRAIENSYYPDRVKIWTKAKEGL